MWWYLKQLNIELPYDSAIPLLGVYLDKTFIQKDTCTLMFTIAQFTIAKTWKQPKCPLTDDGKMWYIWMYSYYSAIKRDKLMPFAAICMESEILIVSEVSQKEKDKHHIISFICGI